MRLNTFGVSSLDAAYSICPPRTNTSTSRPFALPRKRFGNEFSPTQKTCLSALAILVPTGRWISSLPLWPFRKSWATGSASHLNMSRPAFAATAPCSSIPIKDIKIRIRILFLLTGRGIGRGDCRNRRR